MKYETFSKGNKEYVVDNSTGKTILLKSLENRFRRQLNKQGYVLQKSFNPKYAGYFGCYNIVDLYTNFIVTSGRFDMGLDDVENFIMEGLI